MAFIKEIQTPDNNKHQIKNTIIPVVGTQTASTGSWTGNIDVPSLYDGLTIAYFLPWAGSGNASLKLTLNNGSQTAAIPCYISSSRLTTHYAKGTNIIMTYWSAGSIKIDGTATTNNRWIAHADYNTNTDTKVTQTNIATNESYRLLFSGTADDTTRTEGTGKSSKLQFNPSNCTLTFYNETTTDDDIPITLDFDIKDTTTGKTYSTNAYMKWYQDHGTTTSGLNMVIQSGGGMFLGGGEAPNKHYLAKTTDNTDPNNPVHRNYTNEETFITSDSSIHIQSNAGTITNRKGLQINSSLQLVPEQEDVATDNVGSIGTSSYRWANGHFTKINGVTPVLTDTTYTFEDGTNGFTVITNGSGVQTVTVTPSITNNITGSGTSGYLAKFNGTNTITNGPQLGSSTTTYLRNDGTWDTPTDTKNTAGSNNSTSSLYLIGATSQTTGSNGVQTYSNSGLVYDGTSHTLKIGTGNAMGTIQLQAGSTELYNTIIPGLNSQPTSHTLPSSSGTLLNDTDYNSREVTIYTSYNNTMDQGTITKEITGYRDKIKYIDIYYTDNNFYKNGYMGVVSENTNMKRILYSQIPKNDPSITYRISLDLFGDQSSLYLRKHTYYIYESVFQNDNNRFNLCVQPIDGNDGVIVQFVGTPGSGSWGNMTVRAQYGRFIKIYQINLILEA